MIPIVPALVATTHAASASCRTAFAIAMLTRMYSDW